MALLNMGINEWNKASSPCLATRIPYNTIITEENLRMIEKGEDYISSRGIKVLRLRLHGNFARIEVLPDDFPLLLEHREDIVKVLKGLGFKQVSMDLEGYRSGGSD
jgi:pyridinium-3,5-biscarboxylic acid mononucleotide sulfurtransferase